MRRGDRSRRSSRRKPMKPMSYEDLMRDARAAQAELVALEREGDLALVRMQDPPRLNALGRPLTVQLLERLGEVARDPAIRSVVLTGAPPAFSAGGDLRAMQGTVHDLVDDGDEGATAMWRWIRYQFGGVVRLITRTDKVFIAALN